MNGHASIAAQPKTYLALVALALMVALAGLVVVSPLLALAVASGVFLLVLGFELCASPQHFFLAALGLLLTGYAFLGKGFAYLPHKPIFVGDLVLALGVSAALLGGKVRPVLRSPIVWLLLAFAADGIVRTIPYIRVYGLFALRDAVIWGYGAFAILVAAFVLQVGCFGSVVERYGRWFPWLLCWLPAGWLLMILARNSLPVISRVPYATIPDLKADEIAAQLAGMGSFLALGLRSPPERRPATIRRNALWLVWLSAAGLVASKNRASILAIALAFAVTFALRPVRGWVRPAAMAATLVTVALALGVSLKTGQPRRASIGQIGRNIESIFGDAPVDSELMGTRRWRLEWWGKIIGYTAFGKYFWTGKGFGINLADSDGFQVTADDSLRSPHDANATILARMGVPGLVLWLLLQGAFGLSLLGAYFRARARRQEWWSRVNLWILGFWLAFIVCGSFDVFLEGPQAGIWFWSIFGLGIAALEEQKSRRNRFGTGARTGNLAEAA